MVPVSVVIPCFRAAHTMPRALASVLAQSALPQEVIMVDDGSGDTTAEQVEAIVARLGQMVPMRVLRLPDNRGAGEARNVGWAAASGEYIAFLDADDAWHPDKLARQVAFMQRHPEIGVCGHRHRVVINGDGGAPPRLDPGYQVLSRAVLLWSNGFMTPSVMVRAGLPLRFAAGKRHMEDQHLWALAACSSVGIARLEAQLCDIFKPTFGASGLSAQLGRMELGELDSYRRLLRAGHVGWLTWLVLSAWSLARFGRRLAIVALRRLVGHAATTRRDSPGTER